MSPTAIPPVLLTYIEGLKAHDVRKIADTVSEDLAFVSASRTLNKAEFLKMLNALYTGFPDWHYDHDAPQWRADLIAVKWRQGGTHQGVFAMPGLDPVAPTGRKVKIPEHYFFYRVAGERIVMIRPEVVPGGAPRGILEQIGVRLPPL
ncbi:MAG TPA: ester cyclase [Burkholderiales bacterium]|nr:ester cyclase [Burkholderiales bacterium]